MTLAAGDYFPEYGAKIRMAKAATTVAIPKGTLLSWDATNDGFVTAPAATTTYGPYAVAVEAMATGGTQVKVCYGGLVAVTGDGVLEPDDVLQPSTSTAGKVMLWSALTSNAANAHLQYRRACGTYWSDNEDLGDGTIPVDSADADVVLINLREQY
jgi:hypothetical protein